MNDPVEACVSDCRSVLYDSVIKHIDVTLIDTWTPDTPKNNIDFIIKSLTLPSTDEVPIIYSVLKALQNKVIHIYEYETLSIREDRVQRLSKLIMNSIEKNRGIVLILPSLLPISLVSRLPQDIITLLETKLLAEIKILHANILYLPTNTDSIEIVAKKNSRSSYERAEWLKSQAKKMGITVTRIVELSDNKNILEYITRYGISSIYKSVPVTKIASLIVALSKCLNIDGIKPLSKLDTSSHLIYTLGINSEDSNRIINELRKLGSSIDNIGYSANFMIPSIDILFNYINSGCSNAIKTLYDAIYT